MNLNSSASLTDTHYLRTIGNILLGSVCSLLGPHLDDKLKAPGVLPVQRSSPSVSIPALFELAAARRKSNSHRGAQLKAGRGLCGCSQPRMGEPRAGGGMVPGRGMRRNQHQHPANSVGKKGKILLTLRGPTDLFPEKRGWANSRVLGHNNRNIADSITVLWLAQVC